MQQGKQMLNVTIFHEKLKEDLLSEIRMTAYHRFTNKQFGKGSKLTKILECTQDVSGAECSTKKEWWTTPLVFCQGKYIFSWFIVRILEFNKDCISKDETQ